MVIQLGNIRAAAYELHVDHLFTVRAKVDAVCMACDHVGKIDPYDLAKYGRHDRLGRIEGKLRCTKCRKLGLCRLRIEWTD